MKKFITLSVFIALFANVAMFGQTATGNCNSITIALSSVPPYPPDCWGQSGGYSNCTYNNNLDCCRYINGTTVPFKPVYILQKKVDLIGYIKHSNILIHFPT